MGNYPPGRDVAAPLPAYQAAAQPARRSRLPWELRLLLAAPLYLVPLGLMALGCLFAYYTSTIPNPMALRTKERAPAIRILARDGTALSDRGGNEPYVPFDLLPKHLVDAVLATEDRRFFDHWGLDPVGLFRAAITNMRSGRVAQGGSTITQQLAKNLFLSSERSYARKAEELVLALWLENRLGKRNILELYLNRVYFGAGAYGIEAAAQRFFNKSAWQVTLPEAAVLAGLLKAPSKYSPSASPEGARARARTVLAKMLEAGMLTPAQFETSSATPVAFADRHQQRDRSGVDYAVDMVLERLPQLVGAPAGELIVETTIDLPMQRRAQGVVQDILAQNPRSEASQAGMVALDLDGAVRVLVGGRSYAESQFNRALRAKRQPGSAFKMFVYLTALESGMKPTSIVHDLPILGSGWSPRNESIGYRGAVTMREALSHSLNAATARLHMSLGPNKTAQTARRLGIQSDLRADASLALGTSEVTLMELTSAYGVVANQGRSLEPYIIRKVRTPGGDTLYLRRPDPMRQLVSPANVAALNDMLAAVVNGGTGRRAQLARHPVAGKTGTSQDFRDAWFVGYSAHMVGGVWVGNDDRKPMQRVMGGTLPAQIWHDVMQTAHELKSPQPLWTPLTIAAVPDRSSSMPVRPKNALPKLPDTSIEAELFADPDNPRPVAPVYGATRDMDGLLRNLGLGTR